ncbi:MAG: ATP-grasp domain-containing protein [Pseudomonadota bacterium]|nr:ATP-grasp domain-containing protein [Pseudomonadota bacterium]
MPSVSRVRSSEAGAAILIAADSGRALAAAARRAGYRPLVADFFDDSDTRGFCAANRLIAGGLDTGFECESLITALEALAGGEAPRGFVYGAGFEDRAGLLKLVAQRWTLFGNPPGVVRSVKDPVRLAELCAVLNIPHPEISARMPRDGRHWLVKSAGGSGGRHVAPAGALRAEGEKIYFQRIAAGEPVSILFLGNGAKARVVGLSRQWAAPAPGEPFRFGGSLRPAGLSPGLETRLRRAARAITAACGLRGLNSIDFLVEGSEYTLIEVNPRPSATLDIFEDRGGSLFRAHVDSCRGRLPRRPLVFSGAAAAGIAYARREIPSMPAIDWPNWTSDRQKARSALRPYDPLCTIKARAETPRRARTLVDARTKLILDRLEHIQIKNDNLGRRTAP